MNRRVVRLSKFFSYVLRHRPESIGLNLDRNGWASVDELLEASRRHGRTITRQQLDEVVATNDKQRFSFSPDRRRIRANQGHSIPVELALEPLQPPELLYHGTADRFVDLICRQGLMRQGRHHVHLSGDAETARRVGGRRGRPAVLTVEAGRMHRDGFIFYCSENGVWLTDSVPREYLRFPEDNTA